jgi:hypothetical protein
MRKHLAGVNGKKERPGLLGFFIARPHQHFDTVIKVNKENNHKSWCVDVYIFLSFAARAFVYWRSFSASASLFSPASLQDHLILPFLQCLVKTFYRYQIIITWQSFKYDGKYLKF